MSERRVFINGEGKYTFKSPSAYESKWCFLTDKNRLRIIGQKLSYIEFHRWLFANLRHKNLVEGSLDLAIDFDIETGFIQTDILLIGSICEAALYSQIRSQFDVEGDNAPSAVKNCFQKEENKIERLSAKKVFIEGIDQSFEVVLLRKKTVSIPEYSISFASLARAALEIGLIDSECFSQIDKLRKDRNTIHIGEESKRQDDQRFVFSMSDREEALATMACLREQLRSNLILAF